MLDVRPIQVSSLSLRAYPRSRPFDEVFKKSFSQGVKSEKGEELAPNGIVDAPESELFGSQF